MLFAILHQQPLLPHQARAAASFQDPFIVAIRTLLVVTSDIVVFIPRVCLLPVLHAKLTSIGGESNPAAATLRTHIPATSKSLKLNYQIL